MTSICSSNHRLSTSKRRLKASILRDYLMDDLGSCSSNGFKTFPRRQSTTVHRLLSAEIRRSERRRTCGLPLCHAVHKASNALLNAVKLLPFPSSSSVKSPSNNKKKGVFSRSFWKKQPSPRKPNNVDGEIKMEEIQRWRSFTGFILDQPFSPTGEATLSLSSSSWDHEKENDVVVEEVMESRDCVGTRVSDGSSVNDIREECENEEKEQLSPISILECPFEDDSVTPPSHQKEKDEKKFLRRSRRFKSLVQLEPVDLEKRIEQYNSHPLLETKEDLSGNRVNRLFALVKSRLIEEPNYLLASHNIDSVVLDLFTEEGNDNETRDEDKLVKIVEEWVMGRQEEKDMFMSWEVREKREIYVREMEWGCVKEDGRRYVVEDLGNSFVTSLIDELIRDMSL